MLPSSSMRKLVSSDGSGGNAPRRVGRYVRCLKSSLELLRWKRVTLSREFPDALTKVQPVAAGHDCVAEGQTCCPLDTGLQPEGGYPQ